MKTFLLVGLPILGLGALISSEAQAQTTENPDAQSTPAAAADSTQPAAENEQITEVAITGTRIQRSGFDAPTPLTSLSNEQLQSANPGGPVDALRQLPILAASSGPRGSTGSSGSGGSFLNLRNLGANRTLVLLDGERFVPTSGAGTVDISLFPTALVKNVEVVTGGASAAYGSDAVTGVVNFVLDRNFKGLKASAQAGMSAFDDDEESTFSLAYGTSFGGDNQGHLLLSGELYKSAGVYDLLDRPNWQDSCAVINNVTGAATKRTFSCNVRSSLANFTGIISGPSAFKGTTFDNDGNPIPFNYGTQVSSTTMIGGDGIKPQFLPLAVPVDRDVYFARASWEFTDSLTGFLETNFGNSDYEYQIGSYDQNLGSTALKIAYDNAFLPTSIRDQMIALAATGTTPTPLTFNKYFADLPRTWIQNLNRTQRAVAGLNGNLASWTWDTHYEYGENKQRLNALWDENLNHMTLAADAVVNPATGQIVCRSSLTDPSNGCVPYNVFGNSGVAPPTDGTGHNEATDAQLAYLTGTDWMRATVKQQNAVLNFNGEPVSTWAGPVSIATGLEWRKESITQTVSPDGLVLNDASGAVGPFRVGNYQPQSGSYNVKEGYVETVAPLAHDLRWAKSLDFNGAVRLTDYSISGNAVTWKAGLTWSVTDEVRFRGTRSKDERSPNLTELFSGAVAAHSSIIDYVTSSTTVNPQALVYTSGNPILKPEVGNTTTLGIVYQPEWATGWETSLDGYHIDISDAIVSLSAQEIVRQCSLGNTALCSLVLRDASGALFGVNTSPQNVQSLETRGADLETSYRFALQDVLASLPGNLTLRGLVNHISFFETQTPGTVAINTAGERTHPKWRYTTQLTYDRAPWTFFLQGRYSGSGYYDKSTDPSDLPQLKIKGQTLVDVNLAYELPVRESVASFYVNVTDLFNKLPPAFTGNDAQNYDPIGRFYRVGVRLKM